MLLPFPSSKTGFGLKQVRLRLPQFHPKTTSLCLSPSQEDQTQLIVEIRKIFKPTNGFFTGAGTD